MLLFDYNNLLLTYFSNVEGNDFTGELPVLSGTLQFMYIIEVVYLK